MADYKTYEAVGCARWYGIDPHQMIAREAAKWGVPEREVRQMFFNAMQWTFDNFDNAAELWGDK